MTRQRRGRWAVIAVTAEGHVIRGQNKPVKRNRAAPETIVTKAMLSARKRDMAKNDQRQLDRTVRVVLGLNVR